MIPRDIAVLPQGLSRQLKLFYGSSLVCGTLILIVGGVSMGNFELNIYVSLVVAGVATLLSGFLGLFAMLRRSMAFHAACLGSAILAMWLGISAYNIIIQLVSVTGTGNDNESLLLVDLFAAGINLMVNAVIIGVEAVVLYLANTTTQEEYVAPPQGIVGRASPYINPAPLQDNVGRASPYHGIPLSNNQYR